MILLFYAVAEHACHAQRRRALAVVALNNLHASSDVRNYDVKSGAPSRNRTNTPLRATDFESAASTSSAIGAQRIYRTAIDNSQPEAQLRFLSAKAL